MAKTLTQNVVGTLDAATKRTALGLRVHVLDGEQPSSAEEISRAELTEYALTMIAALQGVVTVMAAHVDALSIQLGELNN